MFRGLHARIALVAVTAAVSAVSVALASRGGADPMLSAGPASFGAGCTACHTLNTGDGGVEILGAPARYRPGRVYDLGVRVFDPEQAAAGFEISAEQVAGHVGTLIITDALRTEFAGTDPNYVTHQRDGVDDSADAWASLGGSYTYELQWQAPATDIGTLTFFASGNAVNDGSSATGDRYYWAYVISQVAIPGDADGDTDLDLADFASVQNCFGLDVLSADEVCQFLDLDDDDFITDADAGMWADTMGGATAEFPGEYVLADAVRGGQLYDKWWVTAGIPEPVGDHPLYPEIGMQSGSTTFRCKECHGWDYKGVSGAYGSGSHFTGVAGVFGSTMSPTDMFELLRAGPAETPDGHDMTAYGLTDADLWNLVKFVREGVVDTDESIDAFGDFMGSPDSGAIVYGFNCVHCHGSDGTGINFGTNDDPSFIGTVADSNPWELLHKIRYGHPGSPMPASELLGWTAGIYTPLGAHCQELPTE